jgi:hypothetical protein
MDCPSQAAIPAFTAARQEVDIIDPPGRDLMD